MKIFIVAAATVLLFSIFTVFQTDNNSYLNFQARLKTAANDAADAAALFYDEANFAEGIKVFKKSDGNAAILKVLTDSLPVNDDLSFKDNNYLDGALHYTAYYFDGNGTLAAYEDGVLSSNIAITFPYTFEEEATSYTVSVTEPTVIVTVDGGIFDYSIPVLIDPEAIRTSGYEYVKY